MAGGGEDADSLNNLLFSIHDVDLDPLKGSPDAKDRGFIRLVIERYGIEGKFVLDAGGDEPGIDEFLHIKDVVPVHVSEDHQADILALDPKGGKVLMNRKPRGLIRSRAMILAGPL